jgi:acetoin utilization protein AcuB
VSGGGVVSDRRSSGPTVGERMTRAPIVVRTHDSLLHAAQLLEQHRIHGLPVVDAYGVLVGVLSQTDMLRARVTQHLWSAWPGLKVRHVMTAPPLTIGTDATLEEAAGRMEREQVHRLVVVAPDGATPVGIISTTDIVRAMLVDRSSMEEVHR